MTTQRGEDPTAVLGAGDGWYSGPPPRTPGDDAPESLRAPQSGYQPAFRSASPAGPREPFAATREPFAAPRQPFAATREPFAATREPGAAPRRGPDASEGEKQEAARADGFDPGDTGTWRVRDVVPGADGGRRHTTILRYLLGLIAVDHVRSLTRWAYGVPVLGLVLLLVKPRWIGLAVIVLGVLLVLGRSLAAKYIARRSLARRYRPVEDDLRAAVEAGKANLRHELARVGLPTGKWALPVSALKMSRGSDRAVARGKLREVEIHRILPDAQLQRALRVLDEAGAPGR